METEYRHDVALLTQSHHYLLSHVGGRVHNNTPCPYTSENFNHWWLTHLQTISDLLDILLTLQLRICSAETWATSCNAGKITHLWTSTRSCRLKSPGGFSVKCEFKDQISFFLFFSFRPLEHVIKYCFIKRNCMRYFCTDRKRRNQQSKAPSIYKV